jgi:hypothetical protein
MSYAEHMNSSSQEIAAAALNPGFSKSFAGSVEENRGPLPMTADGLISADHDQAGKNVVPGAARLERSIRDFLHRDVTALSHRRAAAFVEAAR